MKFSLTLKTLAFYGRFVILFLASFACRADNRLMAKLIPSSRKILKQAEKAFRKEATGTDKPKKTPRLNLKTNGFLGVYGGYYDFSDKTGFFQFPLRHEANKLLIVITQAIEPILLKGQTVSHLKIKKDAESAFYLAEKKDLGKGSWSWNIQKQDAPTNGKISKLSLIMLTDPANIFIPVGEFPAESSEHMTIPPMHITGRIGLAHAHLKNMDVLRYFEPIKSKTETKNKKVKINQVVNP